MSKEADIRKRVDKLIDSVTERLEDKITLSYNSAPQDIEALSNALKALVDARRNYNVMLRE